jgi:FdhE protein
MPLTEILGAYDRYAAAYPHFAVLLGYTRSILMVYSEFLSRHPIPQDPCSLEAVTALTQVGTPGEVAELAAALARLSSDQGEGRHLFERISFADLDRFLFSQRASAKEQDTVLPQDPEETILARLLLLRPFYLRIRDRLVHRTGDAIGCPICASLPYFARIEKEEGRRILACPLCETQWSFARFTCPFCGVSAKETQYFTTPEWPLHRIDTCGGCGAYIKTALEKERAETAVPLWEDIVTMDLDRAAELKGFKKVIGYGPIC